MKGSNEKAFWGFKKSQVHKYVDLLQKEHERYIFDVRNKVDEAKARKAQLQMELANLKAMRGTSEMPVSKDCYNVKTDDRFKQKSLPKLLNEVNEMVAATTAARKVEDDRNNFYKIEIDTLKKMILNKRNEIKSVIKVLENEGTERLNNSAYPRVEKEKSIFEENKSDNIFNTEKINMFFYENKDRDKEHRIDGFSEIEKESSQDVEENKSKNTGFVYFNLEELDKPDAEKVETEKIEIDYLNLENLEKLELGKLSEEEVASSLFHHEKSDESEIAVTKNDSKTAEYFNINEWNEPTPKKVKIGFDSADYYDFEKWFQPIVNEESNKNEDGFDKNSLENSFFEEKKESKPVNKLENKPESKPENKPESKPENKPKNKPENKPESKPEINCDLAAISIQEPSKSVEQRTFRESKQLNSFWGVKSEQYAHVDKVSNAENAINIESIFGDFKKETSDIGINIAERKEEMTDSVVLNSDTKGGFWNLDLDEEKAVSKKEFKLEEHKGEISQVDSKSLTSERDKNDQKKEDMQSIRNKYIVGKISGETLFDSQGKIIVAKHKTISPEAVEKADAEGKLAELIMNMMIPDAE